MKEVKFRAKTIVTQYQPSKWVYGYYHIAPLTIENFGCGYLPTQQGKKIHCISTEYGVTYQIDPETLGECTGVYDKNGKEVYDGDFIKYDDSEDINHWVSGETALIIKLPGRFTARLKPYEKYTVGGQNTLTEEFSENILVVGNIFGDVELLK